MYYIAVDSLPCNYRLVTKYQATGESGRQYTEIRNVGALKLVSNLYSEFFVYVMK